MIPKVKAWNVRVYWDKADRKDVTVYDAYGPTKLFAWWNAKDKILQESFDRNFKELNWRKWDRITISVKREI
jgi:hypothetical protein